METARTAFPKLTMLRKKPSSSEKLLPESQFEGKVSPSPVKHSPVKELPAATNATCQVKTLNIPVHGSGESVHALLHLPSTHDTLSEQEEDFETGAVLVAGIFGGYDGPSSIYEEIGDTLASLLNAIPVMRVDFRRAGHAASCVEDIYSAIAYLERIHLVSKFVLVGWSFGGAPVFSMAAQEQERVIGCATIASQWDGTKGVRSLKPRPLLLLHGTADRVCGASSSEALYEAYGSGGDRTLHLFQEDDHELSMSRSEAIDLLCAFISKCAGLQLDEKRERRVQVL